MNGSPRNKDNIFLTGSLAALFAKTATPIIVVMGLNGLFTVVDAYFLGKYVGADALTAVTLMFPFYMLLVASATLVSNGFSSIFARLLGADRKGEASAVFGQAIQLAMIVCTLLIALFFVIGDTLTLWAANGSSELAGLGYTYISILIFGSPLIFFLTINMDALRCEGMLRAMSAIMFSSALLNIVFDYLFIAEFGWAVAGSAYATLLAQCCSMFAVVTFRFRIGSFSIAKARSIRFGWSRWGELLALGAPTSLSYIGISLSAALTLYCLQLWTPETYAATAGAYGIITRLLTFSFLPLLGLSVAFQTIAGNNYGAQMWNRSNRSVVLALALAFTYCAIVETTYIVGRIEIGYIFVDDSDIVAEIGRILPYAVCLMVLFGPLMMISTYFQAIGDASRAAILSLSRTYLFALPLTFLLPFWFAEPGIWYAGIVAEILVLALTLAVLNRRNRSSAYRWGLFEQAA